MNIGENLNLCCPHCKNVMMHQGSVEIFERLEDQKKGTLVIVNEEKGVTVDTDSDLKNNPSSRRHGLRVYFWCECCGDFDDGKPGSALVIYQHKGTTYVNWESNRG